jgi:hypothetical protein
MPQLLCIVLISITFTSKLHVFKSFLNASEFLGILANHQTFATIMKISTTSTSVWWYKPWLWLPSWCIIMASTMTNPCSLSCLQSCAFDIYKISPTKFPWWTMFLNMLLNIHCHVFLTYVFCRMFCNNAIANHFSLCYSKLLNIIKNMVTSWNTKKNH